MRFPKWEGGEHCTSTDPEAFFPEEYAPTRQTLRKICAGCPSREPCGEWAIRHELYGFWGGMTPRERFDIRKRLGIVVVSEIEMKE